MSGQDFNSGLKNHLFWLPIVTKLLIVFLLTLLSCGKSPGTKPQTVIQIDGTRFSLETFRTYYELDPTFPGYRKGLAGLKEYAEQIVDRELARRLAEKEGLFNLNLDMKRRLDYARQKAAIRAYYRQVVVNRITITEKELREAYRLSHFKWQAKQIFTPDSMLAAHLYLQLQSGRPFDELFRQVQADQKGPAQAVDLGEIRWGELDPALDSVLVKLPVQHFSSPLKSRWGYHILFVSQKESEALLTEDDFQNRKLSLLKKLRRQKEAIEAARYLKHFLDPYQIRVKAAAFQKIIHILDIPVEQQVPRLDRRERVLHNRLLSHLSKVLRDNPDQLFMVSKQEKWTMRDLVQKLEALPPEKRPPLTSVAAFREGLGLTIRNYFLFQEAHRLGLDKTAAVDSMVVESARDLAYRHYLQKIYYHYQLPDEVEQYYQAREKTTLPLPPIPASILPGMSNRESYRLYYSARQLHHQLLETFPDLQIQINEALLAQEAHRIDWNHPIRMFVIEWP